MANLTEMRSALLRRIRRQADLTGRPELAELYTELVSHADEVSGSEG